MEVNRHPTSKLIFQSSKQKAPIMKVDRKLSNSQCIQVLVVILSAVTSGVSLISLACLYGLLSKHFVEKTGEKYTVYHEALIPGTHFLGAFVSGIFFRFIPLHSNKVKLILANLIYAGVFATPLLTLDFIPYLISRFVLGFALDLTIGSIGSYISILAPDYIRGFLMNLQPAGIVGGLFIGSFFNYFDKDPSYRIPFSIMLGFVAIQTIALFLVEDSSPKPSAGNKSAVPSLMQLIRASGSTKSILITMAFHAFYHLCGINFLTFQQCSLFESYKNPKLMGSSSLFIALISAAVCGQIVDKFGRKMMAIISSTLMAIGMIFLAMNRLLLLGVMVCMVGYNLGLAGVPWIISMEVFPTEYMVTGLEFGVSINWIFGFITTTLLFTLNNLHRQTMSVVYSGLCIIFILIVSLCVKETKGRPRGFQ